MVAVEEEVVALLQVLHQVLLQVLLSLGPLCKQLRGEERPRQAYRLIRLMLLVSLYRLLDLNIFFVLLFPM